MLSDIYRRFAIVTPLLVPRVAIGQPLQTPESCNKITGIWECVLRHVASLGSGGAPSASGMQYPMVFKRKVGLVLLALVIPVLAAADTLILRNGDRLNGQLIEIDEGTLVFRTQLAGKMLVPMSQVSAMDTDGAWSLKLKDGGEVAGRFHSKEGVTHIQPLASGTTTALDLAAIQNAKPHQAATHATSSNSPAEIDVSAETGAAYHTGTQDHAGLYARLTLKTYHERYELTADTQFGVSGEVEFPSQLRSRIDWTFRPDSDWRPYVLIEANRAPSDAIDLRAQLSLGLGHAVLSSDRHDLDARVGLAPSYTWFDADSWRQWDEAPENGLGRVKAALYYRSVDTSRHREDVSIDLSLHHLLRLTDTMSLEQELRLLPNITDWDRFRGTYESNLLVPLTQRLELRLNLRVDYDAEPEYRYLDEWRATFGAGIKLDF